MSATNGARRKTHRSARAGVMSSFWTNFTPSATSCAHPWKPPAYIGPSRPCMCAITLCSVWPTSSGSTRKAASTATARSTTSSQGARWSGSPRPPLGTGDAGGLHAAAARRPGGVVALARLLGPGPRLGGAGGEHERLAQRRALEALGQQERSQAAGRCRRRSRRTRCRTSRGSRARARPRRGRSRSATAPGRPRGPASAAAPTSARPARGCRAGGTRRRSPASSPSRSVSSTAVSQSKYA